MKTRLKISITIFIIIVIAFTVGTVHIIKSHSTKHIAAYSDLSATSNTNNSGNLKIIAVGDILLGRGVQLRIEKLNNDYTYPFLKVADILKKGDIIYGNLEESITDRTHCLAGITQKGGKWVLKNPVAAFKGIQYCGFNYLNLANNHILDYYKEGMFDTIDLLDKHNIAHSGAGKNLDEARKPAIIEKNGLKIGFLSYTDMADVVYVGNPPLSFNAGKNKPGVSPTYKDNVREDVKKIKGTVDLLVVSFHWGKEDSFDVWSSQINFAHELLDTGVDVILGHHPHRFHGVEIYKGKPIVYSMGNFLFDQNDKENKESFIVDLDFKNNKLTALNLTPVRDVNKIEVVPQNADEAADMLTREKGLCEKLNTKCHIDGNKLVFDIP